MQHRQTCLKCRANGQRRRNRFKQIHKQAQSIVFGPLSLFTSQPTAKIVGQHQRQISKKSHVTHCTHLTTVTNAPHQAQNYRITLFKATGGRFLRLKLSASPCPPPPSSLIGLLTYAKYKCCWHIKEKIFMCRWFCRNWENPIQNLI